MYVNYGSVTAIGIIFPVLGLLAFGLRTYGRRKHFHGFNATLDLDDIFILPAVVLDIAAGVAMVIGSRMKFVGGHTDQTYNQFVDTTHNRQVELEKFEYAFWLGHILAIGFIKLSFLFFFRRVFRGRGFRTAFDYANWSLIGFVLVWIVVYTFFEIFQCGTNFGAAWGTIYELRHDCIDTFAMQTSAAVSDFVIDIALLIEPLATIGRLRMETGRKLQASIAFMLAFFAVVASLLRMIVWIQIEAVGISEPTISLLGQTYQTSDDEGVISLILFWTYVEIGVGFLVICLIPCGKVIDDLTSPVISAIKSLPSLISNVTSTSKSTFSSRKDSVKTATYDPKPNDPWNTGAEQSFDSDTRDEEEKLYAHR